MSTSAVRTLPSLLGMIWVIRLTGHSAIVSCELIIGVLFGKLFLKRGFKYLKGHLEFIFPTMEAGASVVKYLVTPFYDEAVMDAFGRETLEHSSLLFLLLPSYLDHMHS